MKSDKVDEELVEEIDPDIELITLVKWISIILLLLLCIFFAIVIPSIKSVFSIVGVTAGNLISFILPPIFYLKIIKKYKKKKKNRFLIVMAWISSIFGIISLILGLSANVIEFF